MPIIKKIKILKNKVKIHLDNGEILELDKNVYPNFYLYQGKDISNKELKKIKESNGTAALLEYALKIRQKSLYSEYRMREKLYDKGASKEQVDQVIKVLKQNDLIDDNSKNDSALASDLTEYYNSLNYGKNKIISKLVDKGIFMEKLEKINFPISTERKKANNQLPKLEKKYSKYNDREKKQHIYNALISLGFDSQIAKETADKVKESSYKEENAKLEKDFSKTYKRLKRKYSKKKLRSKLINYLALKGYKINDIIKLIERKKI